MKTKKIKIGVIYGGRSSEHEVSISTAKQILKALDKKKYSTFPVYISKTGQWPKEIKLDSLQKKMDLAFIAMHGSNGEDGKIQGFFETLGIPYTFSGVLASSLAMDKYRSQQMLAGLSVKSPESVLVTRYAFSHNKQNVIRELKHLGQILIVKPNQLGSSVGVQKIFNKPDAVSAALKSAFKFDEEVLVQRFIKGREVTASVLGNDRPKALPLVEIIPKAKNSVFYDYTAKYEENGSEHLIPAKFSKLIAKDIETAAVLAHLTFGCRGASRSDFIVTDSQEIYYLETNTIPGMTPTSLFPQAAAHSGINFSKLLDTLIQLAL